MVGRFVYGRPENLTDTDDFDGLGTNRERLSGADRNMGHTTDTSLPLPFP